MPLDHDQLDLAWLQITVTALVALGAVVMTSGMSSMFFVQSANLSLIELEAEIFSNPSAPDSLKNSFIQLKDALESTRNDGKLFTFLGLGMITAGILVGIIRISKFRKSASSTTS